MNRDEKKKALQEIAIEQMELQSGSTAASLWKIPMLEVRKAIIMSQPIPKFTKGGKYDNTGPAIVGDHGKEEIIFNRK